MSKQARILVILLVGSVIWFAPPPAGLSEKALHLFAIIRNKYLTSLINLLNWYRF